MGCQSCTAPDKSRETRLRGVTPRPVRVKRRSLYCPKIPKRACTCVCTKINTSDVSRSPGLEDVPPTFSDRGPQLRHPERDGVHRAGTPDGAEQQHDPHVQSLRERLRRLLPSCPALPFTRLRPLNPWLNPSEAAVKVPWNRPKRCLRRFEEPRRPPTLSRKQQHGALTKQAHVRRATREVRGRKAGEGRRAERFPLFIYFKKRANRTSFRTGTSAL